MALEEYDQKGGRDKTENFKKVETHERSDSDYFIGLENVSNSQNDAAISAALSTSNSSDNLCNQHGNQNQDFMFTD